MGGRFSKNKREKEAEEALSKRRREEEDKRRQRDEEEARRLQQLRQDQRAEAQRKQEQEREEARRRQLENEQHRAPLGDREDAEDDERGGPARAGPPETTALPGQGGASLPGRWSGMRLCACSFQAPAGLIHLTLLVVWRDAVIDRANHHDGARRQETLPALSARALLERGMGLLQTITQAARGLPQPGPDPDPDVAVFLAHGGRQVASATLPRSEFRDLAGQPVHSVEVHASGGRVALTACVGSCMWVFPLAGPGRTPLADPRAWPFVGEDFDCIELYHDDHWHRRPGRGRYPPTDGPAPGTLPESPKPGQASFEEEGLGFNSVTFAEGVAARPAGAAEAGVGEGPESTVDSRGAAGGAVPPTEAAGPVPAWELRPVRQLLDGSLPGAGDARGSEASAEVNAAGMPRSTLGCTASPDGLLCCTTPGSVSLVSPCFGAMDRVLVPTNDAFPGIAGAVMVPALDPAVSKRAPAAAHSFYDALLWDGAGALYAVRQGVAPGEVGLAPLLSLSMPHIRAAVVHPVRVPGTGVFGVLFVNETGEMAYVAAEEEDRGTGGGMAAQPDRSPRASSPSALHLRVLWRAEALCPVVGAVFLSDVACVATWGTEGAMELRSLRVGPGALLARFQREPASPFRGAVVLPGGALVAWDAGGVVSRFDAAAVLPRPGPGFKRAPDAGPEDRDAQQGKRHALTRAADGHSGGEGGLGIDGIDVVRVLSFDDAGPPGTPGENGGSPRAAPRNVGGAGVTAGAMLGPTWVMTDHEGSEGVQGVALLPDLTYGLSWSVGGDRILYWSVRDGQVASHLPMVSAMLCPEAAMPTRAQARGLARPPPPAPGNLGPSTPRPLQPGIGFDDPEELTRGPLDPTHPESQSSRPPSHRSAPGTSRGSSARRSTSSEQWSHANEAGAGRGRGSARGREGRRGPPVRARGPDHAGVELVWGGTAVALVDSNGERCQLMSLARAARRIPAFVFAVGSPVAEVAYAEARHANGAVDRAVVARDVHGVVHVPAARPVPPPGGGRGPASGSPHPPPGRGRGRAGRAPR